MYLGSVWNAVATMGQQEKEGKETSEARGQVIPGEGRCGIYSPTPRRHQERMLVGVGGGEVLVPQLYYPPPMFMGRSGKRCLPLEVNRSPPKG